MEDPEARESAVFVEGSVEPLDVSRECELAVMLWEKTQENNKIIKDNEKLKIQVQRCETALRKCNSLIDEYFRRMKQKDRIIVKIEAENEEVKAKLIAEESSRKQMARTFGKHRRENIEMKSELKNLTHEMSTFKENTINNNELQSNTITELQKNLTAVQALKQIESEKFKSEINELKDINAKQKSNIDDLNWNINKLQTKCTQYKQISDDCEKNIPNTEPYKELLAKLEETQSNLDDMTASNELLQKKVDHLTTENHHVVSFAMQEGLEIPGLEAVPDSH